MVMKITKAEDYRQRNLLITVEASATHCSGDCPSLSTDGNECIIFQQELEWDTRKQQHGQFRCDKCKVAETMALERNASPERGTACTRQKCENPSEYVVRWCSQHSGEHFYAFSCKTHLLETMDVFREDAGDAAFRVGRR